MRNVLAIVATALSITAISGAASAQQAEPETVTRVIYQGRIVPGAQLLRHTNIDVYEQAVVDTLGFCDGRDARANRFEGYDLDLFGSIRGGDRGTSYGARVAGDVLEYYEDRADDRHRSVANFCDDFRDEYSDIRRDQRRERRYGDREARREDRRASRDERRAAHRARRGRS